MNWIDKMISSIDQIFNFQEYIGDRHIDEILSNPADKRLIDEVIKTKGTKEITLSCGHKIKITV